MKLTKLVEKCGEAKFGPLLKTALDHAVLLDGECLRIRSGGDAEERGAGAAKVRQDLFEEFCAIFARAGLPVPGLERETILAQLPAKSDEKLVAEASRVTAFVDGLGLGLAGSGVCSDIGSLAQVVRLLPDLLQPFGSVRESILALLNSKLLEAGLPLLRPDHATLKFGDASGRPAPDRTLSVLIVDDEAKQIVRTFRAIAGWPGLAIGAIMPCCGWNDDAAKALAATAADVIACRPDIVVMDQGIGGIRGSDLIRKIGELMPDGLRVVFVGNTGGSPQELEEAGAIGNMDKGENIRPFLIALDRAVGG